MWGRTWEVSSVQWLSPFSPGPVMDEYVIFREFSEMMEEAGRVKRLLLLTQLVPPRLVSLAGATTVRVQAHE